MDDAAYLQHLRRLRKQATAKNPDLPNLVAEGKKYGLNFTKHHSKSVCIRRIMAERAKRKVDETPEVKPSDMKPPNAEFESAVHQAKSLSSSPAPETSPPKIENRGGERPGAGRPEGLTSEKARMNNLPQQPNPAVQAAVCALFETWSLNVKVPEVALTEQEAFDLALPYTQALSYAGYDDKIPPWAMLAVTGLWNTYNIVKLKMTIVKAARPDLFESKPGPVRKESTVDGQQPGSDHNHSDGQAGVGQDVQGKEPNRIQKTDIVL